MKEEKFKYFTLVLYPEDSNHCNLLNYLSNTYTCKYILHDKDINKDGELKKSHWHIVWQTPSPRTISSLKKELNIDYLESVRTQKQMLAYLIHANDSNKYQYPVSDLKGDLSIENDTEDNNILLILDFIENSDVEITIKQLNYFCAKNGLWSHYRRSSYIFIKTLEEHNKLINFKKNY
jgi:hypothetical protein